MGDDRPVASSWLDFLETFMSTYVCCRAPIVARPALWFCVLLALGLGLPRTAPAHAPAEDMVRAAEAFLVALDDGQRSQATFSFSDQQRKDWHFIPRTRQGLPLKEMTTSQRQLAYALLQTPLSHRGLMKSLHIMTLEKILHELEGEGGRFARDPELYYFSVFGTPSTSQSWGWRVEGHHLSLNFTVVNGHDVVSTPSFFGSNPAEVKQGPRKGLRVLGAESDLGRQLVRGLTPEQQEVAIIATEAPSDIINGPGRQAQPLKPEGLPASEMDDQQLQLLEDLVKEYVFRLRPELAQQDLRKIAEAGFKKLHFAWAGGLDAGQGHYYRVQGPTFILEYDNTQNNANHVHCVWRDFDNDFGEDLLKKHYQNDPHHQP
jgi:hypothetical protein